MKVNVHCLIKNIFKRIRFIFWVVLILSVLSSLPNFFLNADYKITLSQGPGEESSPKNSTAKIDIGNPNIKSASLISRIVGQEFNPSTVRICLENDSKPNPVQNLNIVSIKGYEELGSLQINVTDKNTSKTIPIYARLASTTCATFPGGNVFVNNDIETKYLIVEKHTDDEVSSLAYMNVGNSKVKIRVLFDVNEFLFELLINFLGLSVIFQIFGWYFKPIVKNSWLSN